MPEQTNTSSTTISVKTRGFHGREASVSIQVNDEGMTAARFVHELVRPLLLALQYAPGTVDEVLGEQ